MCNFAKWPCCFLSALFRSFFKLWLWLYQSVSTYLMAILLIWFAQYFSLNKHVKLIHQTFRITCGRICSSWTLLYCWAGWRIHGYSQKSHNHCDFVWYNTLFIICGGWWFAMVNDYLWPCITDLLFFYIERLPIFHACIRAIHWRFPFAGLKSLFVNIIFFQPAIRHIRGLSVKIELVHKIL